MARTRTCARVAARPLRRSLLSLALSMLAACGGGGGDAGDDGPGTQPVPVPGPLTITAGNARAVAADALAHAMDVRVAHAASFLLLHMASGAVSWNLTPPAPATQVPAPPAGAPLATPVQMQDTYRCGRSGSISVTRTTTSTGRLLTAGDTLAVTASACRDALAGVDTVMTGGFDAVVTQGAAWTPGVWNPAITLSLVLRDFSLLENGGPATTARGDMVIRVSDDYGPITCFACPPMVPTTIVDIGGAALTQTQRLGERIRTSARKNYTQRVLVHPDALNPGSTDYVLAGEVVTSNTRLAPAPVTYALGMAQGWNVRFSGDVTAGILKVNAQRSSLALTVPAWNVVELQVDTDGDDAADVTLTTSPAELRSLMPGVD